MCPSLQVLDKEFLLKGLKPFVNLLEKKFRLKRLAVFTDDPLPPAVAEGGAY